MTNHETSTSPAGKGDAQAAGEPFGAPAPATATIDQVFGVLVALNYWCCIRGVALVVAAAKDGQLRFIDHLGCKDVAAVDDKIMRRLRSEMERVLADVAEEIGAQNGHTIGETPATLPFLILEAGELADLLVAAHRQAVDGVGRQLGWPLRPGAREALSSRITALGPLGLEVAQLVSSKLRETR